MLLKQSLDHLFRHEYSKIVAYLTARYGAAMIDRIEDAVQDALLRAMQVWGYQQLPKNPSAWIYRVASNRLIDVLRRENRLADFEKLPEIGFIPEELKQHSTEENALSDELLQMIFACCHPSLNPSEQIALSLKLLCGLSIKEIAKSLLKKEAAIKKTVTRGKQKFKNLQDGFVIPEGAALGKRLEIVLKVLYLLFNEGYKATGGDKLIKKDICEEAIRLASMLYQNPYCKTPALNALLALMCFNAARLDARVSGANELLTLADQDRTKWDDEYIQWGIRFLEKATNDSEISAYQLEAGIAGYYVTAPSFSETNWAAILESYNILRQMNPSPVVALNRVVVLEKVQGVAAAMAELAALGKNKALENHYLFYVIKADLLSKTGNLEEAHENLKRAIKLTENIVEIGFLKEKLTKLGDK